MNKHTLVIEMPELDETAIIGVYHFLQEMMQAFESHYVRQLRQYYQQSSLNNEINPF